MNLADILTDRAHQMADASPPPLPREILDNILEKLQDASVEVDVEMDGPAPVPAPPAELPESLTVALRSFREAGQAVLDACGNDEEWRRACIRSDTQAIALANAFDAWMPKPAKEGGR